MHLTMFEIAFIGERSGGGTGKKGVGTGKKTLRLRSKGPATVEVVGVAPIQIVVVGVVQ